MQIKLVLGFDIDNAVNKAYNIGRDGNIITNNYGETGVIYIDEETPAIPSRVIFDNKLCSE